MPVLDLSANRIQTQVVTAYQEGKALRLAQRNEDLQMERQRQQMQMEQAQNERAERADGRAERKEQRELSAEEQEQLDAFKVEAEPFLRKGDFEGAKAVAKMRGLPEGFTREKFDVLVSLLPEVKPAEYTLGKGAVRMRGDEMIASNIPAEAPRPSSSQQDLQEAVRIQGDPNATQGQRNWAASITAPPNEGEDAARERKLKDYQELWGVSRKWAVAVADNKVKTEANPISGRIQMTNQLDGSVTELDAAKSTGAMSAMMDGLSDVLAVDEEDGIPMAIKRSSGAPGLFAIAPLATGIESSAAAVWNKIPIVGELYPAIQVEMARSYLKTSTQGLIRSLVLNERYPIGEQNRIRDELDIEPAILNNATALRSRMVSIHQYLSREMQANERVAADPNQPEAMRGNALRANNDIQKYLETMDMPHIVMSDADYDALPPGSVFIEPETNFEYRVKP